MTITPHWLLFLFPYGKEEIHRSGYLRLNLLKKVEYHIWNKIFKNAGRSVARPHHIYYNLAIPVDEGVVHCLLIKHVVCHYMPIVFRVAVDGLYRLCMIVGQ